jgi:hypothetical protein
LSKVGCCLFSHILWGLGNYAVDQYSSSEQTFV